MRSVVAGVIETYGGKCRCCAESTYEFLAIDHLDNDGAEDRKVNGRGAKLIGRIIRAGFPPRYQILCHNCNNAKAFHSRCPHEANRLDELLAAPPHHRAVDFIGVDPKL
jgi:hypothetical protein